jgi:hypothetical protein
MGGRLCLFDEVRDILWPLALCRDPKDEAL